MIRREKPEPYSRLIQLEETRLYWKRLKAWGLVEPDKDAPLWLKEEWNETLARPPIFGSGSV